MEIVILDNFEELFPGLIDYKGNILIFANYRTGSTALGMLCSKIKSIQNFPEVLDKNSQPQLYQAKQLIEENNCICVSIMPAEYKIFQNSFLNQIPSYKIHVTRKDKIAQITSLYISAKLAKFQCFKNEQVEPYVLPIDYNIIDGQINTIKNLNSIAEQTKINYNVTVNFEDIKPLLGQTDIKEFVKPENWNEIYSTVKERYNY